VVFASKRSNVPALSRSIERELARDLGYQVGVIVRSLDDLEAIAGTNPFRGIRPSLSGAVYGVRKGASGALDRNVTNNFVRG
jgi:uncharacterized protein (DUF1697 family)